MSGYKIQATKCWDCARATGGCSWSDFFKPVSGWIAIPTKINSHKKQFDEKAKVNQSYIVIECPEFLRDAYAGGLKRFEEDVLKG